MGRKKTKSSPKFSIQLNKEQREVFKDIKKNDITIITGQAGSGKTLLATYFSLDKLFVGDYEKIIITRPTVSKEEIGFLPGDISEKLDPWLQPIYHNMKMCVYNSTEKKKNLDKRMEDGEIEIAPISFLRGRTFLRSVVIVDEAQNLTKEQMEMVIGRLGLHSKMIICGDVEQIDLKKKDNSGLAYFIELGKDIEGFNTHYLKENHRHPIVKRILDKIDKD